MNFQICSNAQMIEIAFKIGSGYRSACGPSYLKTYLSVICNVTVTHDECAVDCSRLDKNVLNLKPKLKP